MLSLIPLALLASLALLALYFRAPRKMELKPIRVRARRQP
jgi:hypothetical protein